MPLRRRSAEGPHGGANDLRLLRAEPRWLRPQPLLDAVAADVGDAVLLDHALLERRPYDDDGADPQPRHSNVAPQSAIEFGRGTSHRSWQLRQLIGGAFVLRTS